MQNLERAIEKMQERVDHMSPAEIRQAESAGVRFRPERMRYARALLKRARESGAVSTGDYRTVEHTLDTWDRHSLATRLVVLAWVDMLSDSQSWRQDAASPTVGGAVC